MPKIHDLTGRTFGNLTAIYVDKEAKRRAWVCECACGKRTTVATAHLISGHTRSCGCLLGATTTARSTKHGQSKSGSPSRRAYVVWMNMKGRCLNPNNPKYPRYGGRGIKVCDRWMDFANFLADMGDRPPGSSIDRIDNDGHYEPGNCRWATPIQQQQNNSRNVFLTARGRKACLVEWSRITKVGRKTIRRRLKEGWDVERAVSAPMNPLGGRFKPKPSV
jgi:hypothetical protein